MEGGIEGERSVILVWLYIGIKQIYYVWWLYALYIGIEQIYYVWWLYALYCIEQMSDDSMLNHIGIEHICYVWRL